MGDYTENFGMYKPAPSELVDVEDHLNFNWNILDLEIKRLMEYRYTNVTSINTTFASSKRPMHRFYKTWSNSLVFENFNSDLDQDPKAQVYNWVSASSLMAADWSNKSENGVYYRRVYRPDIGVNRVEWTGSMEYKDGALITPYVEFSEVLTLPSSITPKMSRYFHRTAGNCAAGSSTVRMIFNRLGHMSFIRYGDNPSSGHDKIDFGSISYDVNLEGS